MTLIFAAILALTVASLSAVSYGHALQEAKGDEAPHKLEDLNRAKQILKEKSAKFLVSWLREQSEEDFVFDENGLGIRGNETRTKSLIYDCKISDGGYIVETEFRIKIPGGQVIKECLTGTGETIDEAINETLLNFTLPTFDVAYKAFMSSKTSHQQVAILRFASVNRRVFYGDAYTRTNMNAPLQDFNLNEKLNQLLVDCKLEEDTQWIKVVYGQHNGKPIAFSVTLNNKSHIGLTKKIKMLEWPKLKGYYITQQFLVIEAKQ